MTVRSTVFVGPKSLVQAINTDVLAYTVPANRTAIFKELRLHNKSAAACDVRFSTSPSGLAPVSFYNETLAASAEIVLPMWSVLLEAGTVWFRVSVTNAVNVWLSGTLLDGDPA